MPSTVVANTAEGPAVKRQKVNGAAGSVTKQARESRIFTPFRVRCDGSQSEAQFANYTGRLSD